MQKGDFVISIQDYYFTDFADSSIIIGIKKGEKYKIEYLGGQSDSFYHINGYFYIKEYFISLEEYRISQRNKKLSKLLKLISNI